MAAKILISGLSNSGKTSLLKGLGENVLVFARDGKKYPFPQPHVNMPDFVHIDEFINLATEKIEKFKEKMGHYPETVAFDSVSRIFTEIVNSCDTVYKGYEVWSQIDKQITKFTEFINEVVAGGMNTILIAHVMWDEKTKKYIEVSKGSFGKIGGFIATVDYAVYIDLTGNRRTVFHKAHNMARSLLEDVPVSQPVEEFDIVKYIEAVNKATTTTEEKWSL